MPDHSPGEVYQNEIKKHQTTLGRLKRKRNRMGWARLFVFIITLFVSYQVFSQAGWMGILPLAAGMGVLLFLVSIDVNNQRDIRNVQTLLHINEEELKILGHEFHHRFDGSPFAPQQHNYANDLDLFGKASVYQWINRCFTEQGRILLAKNLLEPLDAQAVKERQEAVKETAAMIAWRQQFQSFAEQTIITKKTEERTLLWLAEEEKYFTGRHWKPVVLVYSLITTGSLLASLFGFIPAGIFSFLFGIYFINSIILSRNTIQPYIHLSGIVREISVLQQLVEWIEKQEFRSGLMRRLQAAARSDDQNAADAIRELKAILDRFDFRLNIAGLLFFNSLLLWDVRQMMALNEWRRKHRRQAAGWFAMIAETEVVNSFAAVHFNHPAWAFPSFEEKYFVFHGKSMGHPLILENVRVDNDFTMEGPPKIALVTGSNMAGKSTFLRSLGVNTVLALAGAPVCARQLTLSPVRLMSSMRIADNLAENTSTFYAELKKLKTIIEAVKRHEQVFILLDEILRGTNSFDRHTGSAALIAQLVREKAVAVIATHDVELAKLEARYPEAIENYHFDVQVEGEELYFDYRLKSDVCTSLNASLLMKKIGIEL